MSRKFFGLMAVAGMAIAAGLGGATQDAQAGLFGFFGRHSSCGGYEGCGYASCSDSCSYGSCGYDSCSHVAHYEYDDDDACGYAHHGHKHHHGCYQPCGHVQYAAPACSTCSTSTCCSAPVSTCSTCSSYAPAPTCSTCSSHSGCSSCGGYATSVSYGGGCSACGTTSGCVGGACGVQYGTQPMPVESAPALPESAPAPPAGEEAPAPPADAAPAEPAA